jgi:hypothetical protein
VGSIRSRLDPSSGSARVPFGHRTGLDRSRADLLGRALTVR